MREESAKLFSEAVLTQEIVDEFVEEYMADAFEDFDEAFNKIGEIKFKDKTGRLYDIHNLRPWWGYLFEVVTPDDIADELGYSEKFKTEYALRIGDTYLCRVELVDRYMPKQVIQPELAVEVFKDEIYIDIDTAANLKFSAPVVHYSEDGKSAIVYVTVSELDQENIDNYFHYTYAIVCVRTKED